MLPASCKGSASSLHGQAHGTDLELSRHSASVLRFQPVMPSARFNAMCGGPSTVRVAVFRAMTIHGSLESGRTRKHGYGVGGEPNLSTRFAVSTLRQRGRHVTSRASVGLGCNAGQTPSICCIWSNGLDRKKRFP